MESPGRAIGLSVMFCSGVPSERTRSMTWQGRAASWATRPASRIASTTGRQDPSKPGGSGASSVIRQLSICIPASAATTCSTSSTTMPSRPMAVRRCRGSTNWRVAGIGCDPGQSSLWKASPNPGSAGWRPRRTVDPVTKPIPWHSMVRPSVHWDLSDRSGLTRAGVVCGDCSVQVTGMRGRAELAGRTDTGGARVCWVWRP